MHSLRRTYVFNHDKGVECFDYIKSQNLLVTGSADHLVRLWNAYVTSKPIAILSGHSNVVIDIVIHEALSHVISYSKDAIVKVWDIREYTCLQTVVMKFPNTVDGRMPEQGQFPLHLQLHPTPCLIVTCNDYLGQLKLGDIDPHRDNVTSTHNSQLCAAIYNSYFKQVVTGCDTSTVAIWDIETGSKCVVMTDAHNEEEITALAFDTSRRRLITGARNGSIKVWNLQNGHNLHRMEVVGDAEVTGLVHVYDKKTIMAVGWNQKVVQYDDTKPDDLYIEAGATWKGGNLHKEDILAMDICLPNMMATASFDGEILVWTLETEQLLVRLRGNASRCGTKTEEQPIDGRPTSMGSRPNSRHRKSHRFKKGEPAPVDKLLFLPTRASQKYYNGAILISSEAGCLHWWSVFGTNQHIADMSRAALKYYNGAILISSEAGCLHWWSVFGTNQHIGYFYVADSEDECVLALCTRGDNSIIVTGDTRGIIKVWDVHEYATTARNVSDTRPPTLQVWAAHDSAVVSVEYIDHDYGIFVLTASTDHTARLWTIDGQFIGTFGQKHCWNLKTPSSWAHPHTPWTVDLPPEEEEPDATDLPTEDLFPLPEEDGLDLVDMQVPSLDRRDTLTDDLYTDKHMSQQESLKSMADLLHRTFLGPRVSEHLVRKQVDRQGRRHQFSDLRARTASSKYSTSFSPFHSLVTPAMNDESLPSNMPMSQRMISRGYTSHDLTSSSLRRMNLNMFPETPPDTTSSRQKTADDGKMPAIEQPLKARMVTLQ